MQKKLSKIKDTLVAIAKLPSVTVRLGSDSTAKKLHAAFTSRHPKYFLIRNKAYGVALIRLADFSSAKEYIDSVNGKNSAAYFSRKSARAGYTFSAFDPNDLIDEIHEINLSANSRQGRNMDESYTKKRAGYPIDEHNRFVGIFLNEKLVAYLWIVASNELFLMNRILGHADHLSNGIMYQLVTSCVASLMQSEKPSGVVMYDTLFGAGEGLKMFKERCGFKPYKLNWKTTS